MTLYKAPSSFFIRCRLSSLVMLHFLIHIPLVNIQSWVLHFLFCLVYLVFLSSSPLSTHAHTQHISSTAQNHARFFTWYQSGLIARSSPSVCVVSAKAIGATSKEHKKINLTLRTLTTQHGSNGESSNVFLGDKCLWPHAWLHSRSRDAEGSMGES